MTGGAYVTLAMLAGCWRDATPVPVVERHLARSGACPYIVSLYLNDSWLWNHELFPGCSQPPFLDDVSCHGACPMPCREHLGRGSATQTIRYAYVDGRLVAADDRTLDPSPHLAPDGHYVPPFATPTHCTYERGALARCTTPRGPLVVRRDAGGRIIEIEESAGSLDISYDARGDATTLVVRGDPTVTHNTDVASITATLVFDANHRVVEERSGNVTTPYSYDGSGALLGRGALRRDYDPKTGLLIRTELAGMSSTTFSYDSRNRPIRITRQTLGEPSTESFERTYDYDCAP
jgi:YD repeat-containing protein